MDYLETRLSTVEVVEAMGKSIRALRKEMHNFLKLAVPNRDRITFGNNTISNAEAAKEMLEDLSVY